MAYGESGVEVDVEALRRASALLRDAAGPLGAVTDAVRRAVGDAVVASHPALAAALAELATRWAETADAVPRRVDASGWMLRGSVDALAAADEAGAGDIGGPR